MEYKTKGVCAQGIEFEIDDNKKVHNIKFTGGCSGNTQGVAQLAEGMDANEVISRLEGIRCGFKPTSCPDQLAQALTFFAVVGLARLSLEAGNRCLDHCLP